MAIGNAGIGSAGLSPTVSIGGAGISHIYAVAPVVTVGPVWTDNTDGTATVTFTTDIACYGGVDFGTSTGVYTQSAFDYSTYPTLELATAHTVPIPDEGVGGTIADGTYYYRCWAGTPAGFSGYVTTENTGVVTSLSPQAAAVINAYATPPSQARQTLMAALVDGLIADGVWSSLDSLYVTAAPAEVDTYINWKNPGTNNLTKTGTVTHAADVSMTGNGTTGRLTCSTKFNDAGFGWAQNSAHIMVWTTGTRTNAFTCGSDDTITNTARVVMTADNSFDSATFRINTPNSSAGKATTAATGCFLAQRTAAAVSQAYQNGSAIGTADTDASTGECDGKFTLCAGYTTAWAYSSTGIKAGSFGPSLTGTQITALYNRLNTYLSAI